MDIFFSAKTQGLKDFIIYYNNSFLNSSKLSSPLIFHAMSNNDPQNRFDIVTFLIKQGVNLDVVNGESETLFHILFSRQKHILEETRELTCELLKAKIDINHQDSKKRLAIQWLINSKYSDDELSAIYDLIFSLPNLLLTEKNNWGYSPIELAKKNTARANLYARMINYE